MTTPSIVLSAFAAAALCATVAIDARAPQARDAGSAPTSGTASIAGIVVDDADPARPVRRAVVTLTGDGLRPSRGAITDDDGRFLLRELPAGRFTLTAERGGYVTSEYGAKRPARAGTPIIVTAGQEIADLRVRLWRGAVLTGVLRDTSGAPLANTPVSAVPAREVTPAAPTLSNNGTTRSNDLGEYRIFGLEPGTYLVHAGTTEFLQTYRSASEAEIDEIFAALAGRANRATGTTIPEPSATVSSAPIYYPGTPSPSDAMPVTIAAGEERGGLDFVVHRVPVALVRGIVTRPDGTPLANAFARLAVATTPERFASTVPPAVSANSGPDGAFEVGPVSPGDYRLLVRGAADGIAGPGSGSGSIWWAEFPVSVSGTDVDLGTIGLRPGMTFTGRVELDPDASSPPPDLAGVRVELQSESLTQQPAQGRGRPMAMNARFLQPTPVGADGTFRIADLVPGEYRLTISGAALDSSGWWLRSAMLNGRDLLDAPLMLAPGEDVAGVRLVLSDRRTELSGTISTSAGAAVSDLFVVAYPADPALRVPRSRRVLAARPDSGGRFVLASLPPGNYLLCALTDVDEGEWTDPGFLDRLVPASVPVTLGNGERKVQDLHVGGG